MIKVYVHNQESSKTEIHLLLDRIPQIGEKLITPGSQWEVVDVRHEYEITDYHHTVPNRRVYRLHAICLVVKPLKN